MAVQGITGIIPLAITAERDRWYVLHCRTAGRNIRALFVRLEDWLFRIEGMDHLPPVHEIRAYKARGKKPVNLPPPKPKTPDRLLVKRLSELEKEVEP